MRIKKGDNVKIMTGKDRGKVGAVMRAFPDKEQVIVDGLNTRHRHVRPRQSGKKGEVIQVSAPLSISNVQLVCGKCGKATRIGYNVMDAVKVRICKKCGAEV